MEVFILKPDFEPVGVIDYFASAIFSDNYNQMDDFELYVPVTAEALEILKINNFVFSDSNPTKFYIIDNVKIETDAENADYITATGKGVEKFIYNRIAWGLNQLSGSVAQCIEKLIKENLTEPTDSRRKNSLVKIGNLFTGSQMEKQTTGANLLETIIEILDKEEAGFRMEYNGSVFVFSTFKGKDRSYNQADNSPILFSPDFDNLLATEYQKSAENFANVALVAGEGEGKDRIMAAVGNASGTNRIEIYVDARQLSSNTEGQALTPEEYRQVLEENGKDALAENKITESFEAEVAPGVAYEFKKDYFVGDIVSVINEYGIRLDARIVKAVEAWDENGYNLVLTFEKKEV